MTLRSVSNRRPRPRLRETLGRLAGGSASGVLTITRASEILGITPREASLVLTRLVRGGWVARLRRGLYLVLRLEWTPGVPVIVEDPWVLARVAFAPCYVGGWSAAEHWGLTEQVFHGTFVATARTVRRTTERILGLESHLARVSPNRLSGATMVWRGSERVPVSDREKTIADALTSPDWVGGVRHLAEILITYRESPEWNPILLLRRVRELPGRAAFKRLGFLAEALLPEDRAIVKAAQAERSAGVVRLQPASRSRGKLNKRWGLWVNVSLAEFARSK